MKKKHPFEFVLTTCFKARLIEKLLGRERISRLLDIGCGGGYMLSRLENHCDEVFGVDLSPEAIQFAKGFTRAELLVSSAEKLPFKDGEFDCIVSTDVFEHIPDDKKAILEVKRVLRRGGKLILYTPTEVGLFSKTSLSELYHTSEKSYLLDQRYYTVESLTKLLEAAQFKIKFIRYHNVFFQEFFTQLLKGIGAMLKKRYENQSDITSFTNSVLYLPYRWIFFPFVKAIVRTEDWFFETVFKSSVPGHRLIVECEA